jgi:hypothetical protein
LCFHHYDRILYDIITVLQLGGLGKGLTTPPHCKKTACYIKLNRALELAGSCENKTELSDSMGIFLFITMSRMSLGPTQPPIQWVPGALSLGVKWPGHEADHSPSSSAKVKECVELCLHSPIHLHNMVLS